MRLAKNIDASAKKYRDTSDSEKAKTTCKKTVSVTSTYQSASEREERITRSIRHVTLRGSAHALLERRLHATLRSPCPSRTPPSATPLQQRITPRNPCPSRTNNASRYVAHALLGRRLLPLGPLQRAERDEEEPEQRGARDRQHRVQVQVPALRGGLHLKSMDMKSSEGNPKGGLWE